MERLMSALHQNKIHCRLLIGALLATMYVGGCTVGPNYHRSSVTTPSSFKELAGWKLAQPSDTLFRGGWWLLYGDSLLDTLESKVVVSNQSIAAAYAQYREAMALVKSARAGYFPTVSAQGTYTRQQESRNAVVGGNLGAPATGTMPLIADYLLEGNVAWEPDLWGRVRRTVESSRATAQATAADLAAICLSTQAALAQDYFALRVADIQKRLLDSTVDIYKKFLNLTKLRDEQGIASQADIVVAQTQLSSAQAQQIDVGIQRSQLEHAAATLIGQPAALFAIEQDTLPIRIVATPPSLPSTLLERRPDVAAAERNVAAANAQIGVAKAAYYPDITLSASGGYESSDLSNWLTWPSRLWSLGGGLTQTLFTGGLRGAQVEAAKAAYDAQVATYRQTVLSAFENVEDNLAALRILEQEAVAQDEAVSASIRSTAIEIDQYKQGIASALNVITTQTIELTNKETSVAILGKRISASVQLIEALGGGWNADSLRKL
ncbi:MAG: efflux transporter outer membrane subunit [Chitinispirillaceae bacterium]|jgi:NodT family efflux transporter outer membrane factor (OMF) lipoprotein